MDIDLTKNEIEKEHQIQEEVERQFFEEVKYNRQQYLLTTLKEAEQDVPIPAGGGGSGKRKVGMGSLTEKVAKTGIKTSAPYNHPNFRNSIFAELIGLTGISVSFNVDSNIVHLTINLPTVLSNHFIADRYKAMLFLLSDCDKNFVGSNGSVIISNIQGREFKLTFTGRSIQGASEKMNNMFRRVNIADYHSSPILDIMIPNCNSMLQLIDYISKGRTEKIPPLALIENVTIGSDFEMFLFDEDANEIVNAEPYIKGDKFEPFNFDTSNPYWLTSLDNVLAEGNIPPCKTMQEFNSNIEHVLDYITNSLPPNIKIVNEPAVYMNPKYLNTPSAMEFGCTPSYNAYTLEQNPSPDGLSTNLRTGAFHVHIRYDNMKFDRSAELIRIMDVYLGLPSLLLEPPNDRRQLYGTAGEFRFHKEKTTEYRVLSSYFLRNEQLRMWVYQNTMLAIEKANDPKFLYSMKQRSSTVREIIQTQDTRRAEKIIKDLNIPLYV